MKKTFIRYSIECKEIGSDFICKPSINDISLNKEDVIKFFGLSQPDIQWFKIYKVYSDGSKIRI